MNFNDIFCYQIASFFSKNWVVLAFIATAFIVRDIGSILHWFFVL